MEIAANQKFIHTSPRKLKLVADMVRKLKPLKALEVLEFTTKGAAKDLSKAVKAVLANAKQKGLEESLLEFKTLEVNEGPRMKRYRAGTRGRPKPYKRRMAHIKIVLSDEGQVISQKKEKKQVKQRTVKEEKSRE